jgi:hypothetical protein
MTIRFSDLPLWERYEERIRRLFIEALALLRQELDAAQGVRAQSEDDLNRRLYICLAKANFEACNSTQEYLVSLPAYEARNQPSLYDEQHSAHENKRPDFQCKYYNRLAKDFRDSEKVFTIECKRLGDSGSSSWKLNRNYIEHGARRFAVVSFAYGKGHSSGAMIGYVQSLELQDILDEVNEALVSDGLPELAPPVWRLGGVTELSHQFVRPFPHSPFTLLHLWTDLRPKLK